MFFSPAFDWNREGLEREFEIADGGSALSSGIRFEYNDIDLAEG